MKVCLQLAGIHNAYKMVVSNKKGILMRAGILL